MKVAHVSLCTARLPGSPGSIGTGHGRVVTVLLSLPPELLPAVPHDPSHGTGRTAPTGDSRSAVKPLGKRVSY